MIHFIRISSFLIFICLLIWGFNEYKHQRWRTHYIWNYKSVPSVVTSGRQVIFLIGQGRTGSTLLGSIFNKHSDVLYLFEPLITVEKYHNLINFMLTNQSARTFINSKFTQFLSDVMKCQYRKVHDGYLRTLNFGQFRSHSDKLNNPPFCKLPGTSCVDVSSKLMNELCDDQTMRVVVKDLEFRLPNKDLSFLQYVSKQTNNVDVHVIHLVRDPRAYLTSMKKAGWLQNQNVDTFIKERCDETLKNIQYFTNDKTEQNGHSVEYKLLRFEDFAHNPLDVSRKIHNLLKMEFSKKIQNYVTSSTSGKSSSSVDPYSNSARNISLVQNSWRMTANFEFVSKIQSSCNRLMKILGYNNLRNEKELKNMHEKVTLQPLKDLRQVWIS